MQYLNLVVMSFTALRKLSQSFSAYEKSSSPRNPNEHTQGTRHLLNLWVWMDCLSIELAPTPGRIYRGGER